MNVSTQFLDYNTLAICIYNPTNTNKSVTITYGIQSTGFVTMAMTVLRNTCNMFIHDLSDMNALIPWLHTHVTTIT